MPEVGDEEVRAGAGALVWAEGFGACFRAGGAA
jgi:hypothetical protein